MLWLGRLALLILLAGGVLLPTGLYGVTTSDDTSIESTTITDYNATFQVESDGTMHVVERIVVDFPTYESKHGIFRFFDVVDPNDASVRREPHDLTVTRDGGQDGLEVSTSGNGRYVVAKIGRAEQILAPGLHAYQISYTIDDVLGPGPGSSSQLYWNLIPGGWAQPIQQSRLTVSLPGDTEDVRCAVGTGSTAGCTAQGEGTDQLVVTTGPLPPRTPVTVRTTVDVPVPEAGQAVPWAPRWDPVLGQSAVVAGLVALLGLGGLVVGLRASRSAFEPAPPYPLMYAPPDGLGPAQASYLLTERTDQRSWVASLLQAASAGAITLERPVDSWTITDARGAEGWAGLDEVTARVGHLLSGPGTSFTAAKGSVAAGQTLKSEIADFGSATKSWARQAGHIANTRWGVGGGVLVVLAALAAGALCVMGPMSLLAVVPGLFAIGGLRMLLPGSSTLRTRSGRELWSRIGGFRRVLSTPSSVERFGFSGQQELYTAYIPWAVAFGVAEQWADKYRAEMGVEPPVPSYLPLYVGAHTGNFTDQMVNDFSQTVSSAISAYQATQTSSGSGGGGFSGGGGGGGGGGGSW